MATITISTKEYKFLQSKSKKGWAAFYKSQTQNVIQTEALYSRVETLRNLARNLADNGTLQNPTPKEVIPDFVENELKELMEKLKVEISCPICLDTLNPKKIKFSSCGHKYCETCLSKIEKCAVCRKQIYKKK